MLNTAQVAARIHAIAGEKLSTVNRQVMAWVEGGALPPVGPTHPGYGRERRYDDAGLILAAIAAALSRWGMQTPSVRLATSALVAREVKPRPGVPDSGRLAKIIAGELDAFLVLQPGEHKGIAYFFVPRAEMGEFMASAGASNAIVLDLPKLWRIATVTGFEATSGAAVHDAVTGRAETKAAVVAAAKAAARASREEVESRRLAMEERRLRDRKKALDAKAAKARKAALDKRASDGADRDQR